MNADEHLSLQELRVRRQAQAQDQGFFRAGAGALLPADRAGDRVHDLAQNQSIHRVPPVRCAVHGAGIGSREQGAWSREHKNFRTIEIRPAEAV